MGNVKGAAEWATASSGSLVPTPAVERLAPAGPASKQAAPVPGCLSDRRSSSSPRCFCCCGRGEEEGRARRKRTPQSLLTPPVEGLSKLLELDRRVLPRPFLVSTREWARAKGEAFWAAWMVELGRRQRHACLKEVKRQAIDNVSIDKEWRLVRRLNVTGLPQSKGELSKQGLVLLPQHLPRSGRQPSWRSSSAGLAAGGLGSMTCPGAPATGRWI